VPIYRLGQDHHGTMVRERFQKSTIRTKAMRIQATSQKFPIIKIRALYQSQPKGSIRSADKGVFEPTLDRDWKVIGSVMDN